MKKILNQKFNPKDFEDEIYENWEKNGYFKPNMDKTKESFSIMMPPPNVTGKLHMGHALDGTIQDILIRFKRMQGFNTLWLPGTDHASISTEMKVVEKLKKEGISKYELGREKFLEEAWEWTKIYGGEIQKQQRKLGASCDWDRKRFTLDEGLSGAVLEQFVSLYNKGYIYKGKRMVNWCPNCNTSISDAEVEYKEEDGKLWHIKYQITGTDKYLVVATTRPETMLGDTAVAVHPDDERYKELVGKTCILPIMNKEIPIIADDFVEKDFGTGCVKITPAHDMNDYQAGLRNNLEVIEIFDENFKMGDLVPEYKGLEIIEARKQIVEKLKELGNLEKEEEHNHNVSKCERCKNTIEPKISTQWFVKMKELAKPAIEAVRNDDTKFIPKRYEKTYFNWMENIQDWCISRQLWWGHQIPAYYCKKCNEIHVAKEKPEKCTKCNCTDLEQDLDTLDTWFSSALWPFSTLGWPNKESEDLSMFYPSNVLVTAYDIIFFWVARMIFSGLEVMGEVPFSDVLIHGIVRDSEGRKMSKTLGNGVDPLDVIEKYGADSLRFSVLSGTTMGNDIKYMPEKLDQASNFANKIWNASKFINMNIENDDEVKEFGKRIYNDEEKTYNEKYLEIEDKWIISKMNKLVEEVTSNLENYDLGIALDKIYGFMWNDFCNWYIEIAKIRLNSENKESKLTVLYILDNIFRTSLKLLHPFMPFVTTEIYSSLIEYDDIELMISNWPIANKNLKYLKEEETLEKLQDIIVQIRNIRNEKNIHPSKKAKLIFVTEKYINEIEKSKEILTKFGFAEEILIQRSKENIPENVISIITEGIELYMPSEGLIDLEEEKSRVDAERKKLESEILRCEKMLSNPGFVNKAPQEKIDEEKKKLEKYKDMFEKLN